MANPNAIARDVLKDMDIDALLDLTIDQIAEVEERQLFPTARYQMLCKGTEVDAGTENSGPFIKAVFEVVAVVELGDAADQDLQPDAGTEFQARYYPGYGFESFRTTFAGAAEIIELPAGQEAPTLRQIMEIMPNTCWDMVIEHKTRKDKDTKEVKPFNQINNHMCFLLGETA